jgi:hypothetical protein
MVLYLPLLLLSVGDHNMTVVVTTLLAFLYNLFVPLYVPQNFIIRA